MLTLSGTFWEAGLEEYDYINRLFFTEEIGLLKCGDGQAMKFITLFEYRFDGQQLVLRFIPTRNDSWGVSNREVVEHTRLARFHSRIFEFTNPHGAKFTSYLQMDLGESLVPLFDKRHDYYLQPRTEPIDEMLEPYS